MVSFIDHLSTLGPRLTLDPGLPYDAHTPSCRHRLHDDYLSRFPDQRSLQRRAQRDCLPRRRSTPQLLLHHYRLSGMEAPEGGPITATTMVSWEI